MSDNPAPSIVVLTGAGISRESGLETFRDEGGIWSRVSLEDVATPEAFARDPETVLDFYNARRRPLLDGSVRPNPAHAALARLEAHPGGVLVVTQNIDDLHERAGQTSLIHMHGELLKARCTACRNVEPWPRDLTLADSCHACGSTGRLRPHVVWFGEMPFHMDSIHAALEACSVFVSVGTSGAVYPAAGFVEHVRALGRAHTVEVNIEPTEGASAFAEGLYGPAGEKVPELVERLLAEPQKTM